MPKSTQHIGNEYGDAMERMDAVNTINADLLKALKLMIEGRVVNSDDALHPSKRFCKCCGRNSKDHVHVYACPVLIAELAIAKAEGR